MSKNSDIECRRFEMQIALDSQKSHLSRNELGQFSTPFPLALDIMRYVKCLCRSNVISLLEPAFGTGVFLSAFKEAFGRDPTRTLGFEIDPHYCEPAKSFWRSRNLEVCCADFLRQRPDRLFDLLVTNPPYTRHHHIESATKVQLQKDVLSETGIKISGLAGLYCHFLLLSSKWLKPGGISCWLVPCEFMDVNYGSAVRRYLSENVELVRIHRFCPNDLQFADALVSSCVVVFRNKRPDHGHEVLFSTGGSVCDPLDTNRIPVTDLSPERKWISFFQGQKAPSTGGKTLGDFFIIKRGVATGDNKFFILDESEAKRRNIPSKFLRPILPSPRYLRKDRIESENGMPVLEQRQFLFACDLDEDTLCRDYPDVWQYICEGEKRGIKNGYICSRRSPWYSCEKRDAAPIVVPYMGRGAADGRLFRFILNESDAITTNVYLMLYPRRQFADRIKDKSVLGAVWKALNEIPTETLVSSGRTYGGGLHKLEPKELMMTPACKEMECFTTAMRQPTLF